MEKVKSFTPSTEKEMLKSEIVVLDESTKKMIESAKKLVASQNLDLHHGHTQF